MLGMAPSEGNMAGDQFYSHPTFGLSLRDTHSQMQRRLYIDFELMAEQAALEHFIFYNQQHTSFQADH